MWFVEIRITHSKSFLYNCIAPVDAEPLGFVFKQTARIGGCFLLAQAGVKDLLAIKFRFGLL